ncbi:FkbM family methyltransferase [uncultured Marixanthomonas sp.]|uniref:FkbM family methyltransferase n=1 Tax=uncultured Marixanthomonas sp. TaxID=757245 RepID=UPI0030D84D5D|tara:strand:- start:33009 stop:33938 length:930 start_codon:yes stop_codon:yes gene_type:complete
MKQIKIYAFICSLFPPIVSQSIRNIIFPMSKAQSLKIDFSKKAITGSIFRGNTADDHSYRFAIHGFFDWRNTIIAHRYIKKYKGDIIEIGANVGTETISFCDLIAGKGNVHAFEPLPKNLIALESLAQNTNNLLVYSNAISNKTAKINFQIPPENTSGTGKIVDHQIIGTKQKTIIIDSIPLDRLTHVFSNPCIVSIDTEGHEPFVLEGAKKTIQKFRPAIIIEVSPKLLKKYANSESKNIHRYFQEIDYTCFIIKRYSIQKVSPKDLDLKNASNWFCVPNENSQIITKIKNDLLLRAFIPWYCLAPLS